MRRIWRMMRRKWRIVLRDATPAQQRPLSHRPADPRKPDDRPRAGHPRGDRHAGGRLERGDRGSPSHREDERLRRGTRPAREARLLHRRGGPLPDRHRRPSWPRRSWRQSISNRSTLRRGAPPDAPRRALRGRRCAHLRGGEVEGAARRGDRDRVPARPGRARRPSATSTTRSSFRVGSRRPTASRSSSSSTSSRRSPALSTPTAIRTA